MLIKQNLCMKENLSMKKIVVVTGASSGIGNFIAKNYESNINYEVICLDIVKMLNNNGCKDVSVDLKNEYKVREIFKEIKHIDLAVNCAGVSSIRKKLINFSADEITNAWQDNFLVVFNAMVQEIKIMQNQKFGKIVNIASIAGHVGMRNFLAYSTAKASIINMTKVAAIEHSDDNIRINSISPATIDTPMLRKKYNGVLRDYSDVYYTKNCGTVADVYSVVKMLEENNFMTGNDIKLDGGIIDLLEI